MIKIMNNSMHFPVGSEGSEEHAELLREARELKQESDCPWISSDPQLLAAAAAERVRAKQRDGLESSPQQPSDDAQIEQEFLRTMRGEA
jgi:hypothetical protein